MDFEIFSCSVLSECGGCAHGAQPYLEQKKSKLNLTQINFPQVVPQFHFLGTQGLRERGDFIIHNNVFCLYSKPNNERQRHLIPIKMCPQLTTKTQYILTELQSFSWPIKKGSIRFREAPQGAKYRAGLWLDFANLEIKNLLTSGTLLHSLLEQNFYIEVGQKQKQVVSVAGVLKLVEAEFFPWSSTYVDGEEVGLFSTVSSFTQTGKVANKKFAELLQEELAEIQAKSIIEFGSGIGTLTLPALAQGRKVKCCEFEESALTSLKKTIENYNTKYLYDDRVSFFAGNFHKHQSQEFFQNHDTILVNPPRSGIGDFLKVLGEVEHQHRPTHLLYLSCFIESMKKDSLFFESLGYQLQKIHVIDQFPQSAHFEVLGLWSLK